MDFGRAYRQPKSIHVYLVSENIVRYSNNHNQTEWRESFTG